MRQIHPLVKAARDKIIFHPGQLAKFDQKQWIAFCENLGIRDPEAVAFFNGASWLNEQFTRVQNTRKHYGIASNALPPFGELVRAHIAAANYAFYQVMEEQKKRYVEENPTAIEEMILTKTSMVAQSDPVEVNSVNMQRLDSLRGPLYELFRNKDNLFKIFPGNSPAQLTKINFFLNEMKMSQFYHNFSSLWQDLLYGRTLFHYQKGRAFFIKRDADYHRIQTIAEFRRDHHHAMKLSETRILMDRHPRVVHWPCYLLLEGKDSLTVTSLDKLPDQQRRVAIFQTLAPYYQLDDHLKQLLNNETESRVDRTLQAVLAVWMHLAVLASQLEERQQIDQDINDWDLLLELAPQFDINILRETLCQCTGYSDAEVRSAIVLLTWQGKSPQEDLWAQPLVILGDVLVFSVSALLTANISRNVDIWMSKIDVKDSRRGIMFERDLGRVLEECRAENPVMRKHLNYTLAIEPQYGAEKEEIDLTFSFGQILVVAEARSRKTPITPLDYENELYDSNGLIHKTRQAIRKSAFIKKNLNAFCEKYYPNLSQIENLQVIPLVIINGQFHAGFPLNNVPVIDPALLLHFLKDSELRFNYDQKRNQHQYGLPLWRTLSEAQASFYKYLLSPTLIEIYSSLCIESETRSRNLGVEYDEVVALNYDMQYDDWELFFRKVNFLYPSGIVRYF